MTSRLRILVLGYIVRFPLSGMAMHSLQYAMGLARLGHDVFFLEDSDDYERPCYDPARHTNGSDPSYGLAFADEILQWAGLSDRWAYHDAHTKQWYGPVADEAEGLCKTADAFINVSGVNPVRPWLEDVPVRVVVDTDPVFEQVHSLTVPDRHHRLRQHNRFFTFGENIGTSLASVPDDGLPWAPTRQPLVTDIWDVAAPAPNSAFTTVMQWNSYSAREYDGQHFGMKSESFMDVLRLPQMTEEVLELALGGPDAPKELLTRNGWRLSNPIDVTKDHTTYQRYIQQSKGEFSVAKHGYVVTGSGWFSERSVNYLASGRPVITQETGFSNWMDTGLGVVPFSNVAEAKAALENVSAHYSAHCAAARELAVCYFDSDNVLNSLLAKSMA